MGVNVTGRRAELAAINETVEGAREGPFAIAISGEPGIGKTTVWRCGIAEARRRGQHVLSCRPAQSEEWLSFSALGDLLEVVPDSILAELPSVQRAALDAALLKSTAGPTAAHRRALSLAVTRIVRDLARTEPVVIGVDDAQWLDAPTADVLAFAARRLGDARVLILVTTRSDATEPLPFAVGCALRDDQVLRLRLGPLTPDPLHELIQERTGIVLSRPELLRLHGASGGNPFYAIETARLLVAFGAGPALDEPLPVPGSLAELVTARVRALPERTREALLVASALAHPTVDQVRAAMGGDETACAGVAGPGDDGSGGLLDSAEESGIVDIRDASIRFTHPLFSSAIYSNTSSVRRRRLHRRLSDIVDDAEERAWHLGLAVHGPDDAVAAALEEAARAAQARGAVRGAARLWELANRRTPCTDPCNASRRGVAAATSLFVAGDARRARSMLEEVIGGMTAGRQRAQARLWLATILFYEHSSPAAAQLCRQALAETGGDLPLRAALHLRASWFADHDTEGRVRDAEAAAEILDSGQVPVHPDTLACALLARSYYRFLAGRGIGTEDLRRARRLLSPCGRSWEWAWAQSLHYHWAKVLDVRQAHATCAALRARAAETGEESGAAHTLFHLAESECWLGNLRQAAAHAAKAATAFEQTGQRRWRGLGLYIRALPAAYLGEVDAARAAAEQGLDIAMSEEDNYLAALHLGVLGFAALSVHDFAAADRHLSRADELTAAIGLAEPARHRFHGDYVEAVVARGELERAAAIQRRLEARAQRAPYPWLQIVTARGRALIAAARGDLDAAASACERALHDVAAAGLPFEHARTLLIAGRIRRRRREKLLARQAFLRSCELFDGLGAAAWSAHTATELRRLGLRRAAPHELTPGEERVAQMVAQGLTNREVGAALCVSEKTVEANLSRIFLKLGIRSRRDLSRTEFLAQK
jgi:DNA-binding NarL/FixJ family response regulator